MFVKELLSGAGGRSMHDKVVEPGVTTLPLHPTRACLVKLGMHATASPEVARLALFVTSCPVKLGMHAPALPDIASLAPIIAPAPG